MGKAASLFFSSNEPDKQTLYRRVTPSEEQFDEQQERWNALAEHLKADLRERSGYSIRTWLQGSYKFGTQIRPVRTYEEFDIDLGVYFQWQGEPGDGKHGPVTLKAFVHDSLQVYARDNPEDFENVSPPKPRCARIHYKSSFHIDVPAYHLDPARDLRCLATKNGWEDSDPKAIYVWFRDLFDDIFRAKVRRHVKYVKCWAALKFRDIEARPSSILLTVVVAEAAAAIGASDIGADDEGLRDILQEIVDRLEGDRTVLNPVDASENLSRLFDEQMDAFISGLNAFLDVAKRATDCVTEFAAADIWQEAFAHLIPMPEAEQALTETALWLPVAATMPEIRVTAHPRTNPQGAQFSGTNKIGPIPKNCDIHFEVVNAAALPANSTVVWMVRNEGREAENTNDLGHYAGAGFSAKEHSEYRGTHHMDCMVKVGGRTVAMRRIPVSISGLAMPRRNPTARPSYVKLRGTR